MRFHPTQKPVELFEYLVKTYTNENEIVLDICVWVQVLQHMRAKEVTGSI
ncbi:DNA methyltransferase [Mammaliicoccus sciuri]|nr:DNA methyltransferase [Mammaliicoccus sciuri]